jgi:nucleoside-diphosphate-sugar epimerase
MSVGCAVAHPSQKDASSLKRGDFAARKAKGAALFRQMNNSIPHNHSSNGHHNGNGHRDGLASPEERFNGLSTAAPKPGQRILVAGGAGYIGSVLVPLLLNRGYEVRVLDRLYFGEESLADVRDRIELVVADVRDVPESALDDVDGVINLSGLSNDPTAEFNPEANWQMNAIATETLGRACLDRGIDRYVFASSCSLYDGMPPGMHGEEAPVQPRAAYATSKRYGEERLLEFAEQGLCPVILRNGTVYGWSPRMRFDLVVNTFVKDALLGGALKLHGGGWMWRPLVDVRDCAEAMIAAFEAPAEKVRGEIFNVVHSNYQIRELAMIVAGSVQLTGRNATLEEVPSLALTRNYECANAKLSTTLGFIPRRSVLEAVTDILQRIDPEDRVRLTDPRGYNIRWLELLHAVKPTVDSFATVL